MNLFQGIDPVAINNALFVMGIGLAGVFSVLTFFYVFIVVLERAFRPK